jgi:hypothetical protein
VASGVSTLVNAPYEGVKKVTNNIFPNSPGFVQTFFTYIILGVLFVVLLYFIPITRPLPVAICRYLRVKIANLSNRAASKIEEATTNIEQTNNTQTSETPRESSVSNENNEIN